MGMLDYAFTNQDPSGGVPSLPRCISIELTNRGAHRHNFSVEGTRIDLDVEPGARRETGPLELAEGTYVVFCKYYRARGMSRTFRIKGPPARPTP